MKKNFQRYAIAHSMAYYVYILEVGSLLLWKFGLGCYTPFCSLLALRAAIRRSADHNNKIQALLFSPRIVTVNVMFTVRRSP